MALGIWKCRIPASQLGSPSAPLFSICTENKGSRENKSSALTPKQHSLLEWRGSQEEVAKFSLPLEGPGLWLTLFIEVLCMVPTGFQVGHRSFGVKELVSDPAAKRREGMKFSTGSVMELAQIPLREGKCFILFLGIWQHSRALSACYITRLIKLLCSTLSRWFCGWWMNQNGILFPFLQLSWLCSARKSRGHLWVAVYVDNVAEQGC